MNWSTSVAGVRAIKALRQMAPFFFSFLFSCAISFFLVWNLLLRPSDLPAFGMLCDAVKRMKRTYGEGLSDVGLGIHLKRMIVEQRGFWAFSRFV